MRGLRWGSPIIMARRLRSREPVNQTHVSDAAVATAMTPIATVTAEAKEADQSPDTMVTR